MRVHVLAVLTAFTVLSVLRRLTDAVAAPFGVSVKCDSYGVVVEWMATGLSEQADFLLELKADSGENVSVNTKDLRYNISDLLQDTAYNRYFVKVKARDGGHESEFAESQIFSFNYLRPTNITCDLEFPTVELSARDGKLFVEFINPLHLYRDTPALRKLKNSDTLTYTLSSDKVREEFTCSDELEKCASNVSFPEEQEEYCIRLSGRIRQTRVRHTRPYCYSGTLYPGPPISTILIPVLVAITAVLILASATAFLVKLCETKCHECNLSKFPRVLEDKFTHTLLITLEPERVEIPRVEPAVGIPILPETFSNITDLKGRDEDEDEDVDVDVCRSSGSSEPDPSCYTDRSHMYGTGADLSSSDFSTGYDQPHALPEMSL